jgi:type IV secretory pathway VirD2 relaxase
VVKICYRNGMKTAAAHSRYVGKAGKGLDGGDPTFFDKEKEGIDGVAEVKRWRDEGDVRWWKLPVSPENPLSGPEAYQEMIRHMMAHAEQDLGTKLEWVAATHYDALERGGKVHTHVIIRGRDDQGDPLAIHPDYIMNGFRTHVREFLTYDSRFGLGERTLEEIQRAKQRSNEIREMREEGLELVNMARETGTITRQHAAQMEKLVRSGSAQEIELVLGNIRHEVDRDQERLRERSKSLDMGY